MKVSPKEFVGGPWDGQWGDFQGALVVAVRRVHYPHTVELEIEELGSVMLTIVDLKRPERYVIGFYWLREVGEGYEYFWEG